MARRVKSSRRKMSKSKSKPKKTMKSGPRKDEVVIHPGCYDMADAYVIAKAAQLEHI